LIYIYFDFLGDPNIFSVSTTDGSNGLLSIKSIDRDAGFTEFSIKIRAKEVNDATSIIEQQVQIIVNDANDNTPTITPAQLEASVDEGHIGNINFGEIKVTDPDLVSYGLINKDSLKNKRCDFSTRAQADSTE